VVGGGGDEWCDNITRDVGKWREDDGRRWRQDSYNISIVRSVDALAA